MKNIDKIIDEVLKEYAPVLEALKKEDVAHNLQRIKGKRR
jgi:hypothetical protein